MNPPADNGMAINRFVEERGMQPEFVLEFFCMVARFEYALKRLEYMSDVNGRPRPDWYGFADQHAGDFDFSRTKELESAVEYLTGQPPRQQIVVDGHLGWAPRTRDEDSTAAKWVISCVKGVRNNLFHGGKYPIDPDDDPERARQLIHSSLEVLREVARVDEISTFFDAWTYVDAQ